MMDANKIRIEEQRVDILKEIARLNKRKGELIQWLKVVRVEAAVKGRYQSPDVYYGRQHEIETIGFRVCELNAKLAELKLERKRGTKPFTDCFVEAARNILEEDVFERICEFARTIS